MTESDARFREVLENRYDVLRYLADSAATKPEMVADLAISRSTVDRAVDGLAEFGCVTAEHSRYEATATGRLAVEEHDRYRTTTRSIRETKEFANLLPADAPLDACLLEGATVEMADGRVPDKALEPSLDIFRRARSMRGIAPAVLGFYPKLVGDRLETGDLSVEVVAADDVVSAIPELPGAGDGSLLDAGAIDLYETDADLPYALWVMETPEGTYAGITTYDDGGVSGVLVNDSDDAVEWADAQYRRYRADARPVSSLDG